MAKGKGQSRKRPAVEKKFDGGGSRVNAVNTWDDMEHDSEDDFHDSRGSVLLDHEQDIQRRHQNDEYEGSEEEVFGIDDGEDEEEDDMSDLGDVGGEQEESEEDIDKASWGKTKRSYYNADEIESDEETAKAEEEEALRLQKKRLADMSEEDFAPEEEETAWGAAAGRGILGDKDADRALVEGFEKELQGIDLLKAKQGGVVVEKIAKAGISKLSKQEILKVLQNQSPELLELVEEFKEKIEILRAVAEVLELAAALPKPMPETQAPMPFLRLKYQTLINYLTNIAFYITLKTSPEPASADLRDHPVIDALLELKTSIGKLEKLEEKKAVRESMEDLLELLEAAGSEGDEDEDEDQDEEDQKNAEELKRLEKELAKAKKAAKAIKKKSKETTKDSKPFEYNVDLEDDFVAHSKKSKKSSTKSISSDDKKKRSRLENDYGDLDELLDVDVEDKVQKKKSLRDYKEQRNPRVKHRNKYETAKKKIKSVKRVFTRLEGSYGGEKTGIKTGLARSVKFN
ncbi:hypothetical protein BGZ52_005950 [Haplosporangium bisporale]|nr:hypothetical protein BGZ52_005950 [Haplosporangium bisporale]